MYIDAAVKPRLGIYFTEYFYRNEIQKQNVPIG